MDDLKVYESKQEDLASTLADVEQVASAVGMTLRVRKFAVAHLNKGRLRCETSGVVVSAGIIREIGSNTPYRYLGTEQVFRAHSGLTRARVREEYLTRQARLIFVLKHITSIYYVWTYVRHFIL